MKIKGSEQSQNEKEGKVSKMYWLMNFLS